MPRGTQGCSTGLQPGDAVGQEGLDKLELEQEPSARFEAATP